MLLSNKNNALLISIFFILIGILSRFYQLNFEDYWLDEMNSFWVADPNISLKEMISRRELTDATPLFFNLILKNYFKFFSYNPEIGRHVPLFFGILSIPFLGFLSYKVKKNRNSFLLTILLISINIYLIKYSQETRPYSLVFLLSVINLIIYYKVVSLDLNYYEKIYIFLLFILFSVLSLSSHPFVFIIFFSQIINSIYFWIVFKNKNILFFLSVPFILIIYFFTNYDYLVSLFAYGEGAYFYKQIGWEFFYNYYFSRFFGSKIMGLVYLSTLIFLIFRFRNKILLTPNNYLLLTFILIFSYIIPLSYSFIVRPILTDRYIIFVLASILILISTLIFEIDNKKLKIYLVMIVVLPTLVNHYIEIKFRVNTKPEFTKVIHSLKGNEVKNLSIFGSTQSHKLVENYLVNIDEFKKNNFKLLNIENLSSGSERIWILCYEPLTAFNCDISEEYKKVWALKDIKKMHLLNARLFEIKR